MVRIGNIRVYGSGLPLPSSRSRTKKLLRSIAELHGVKGGVYFVRRSRKHPEGGHYDRRNQRIIVTEQLGSLVIPRWGMAYYFLHELTHHLQMAAGIFPASYRLANYSQAACRRVTLACENHANRKSCELLEEFFGLRKKPLPYPEKFLREMRPDLFEE